MFIGELPEDGFCISNGLWDIQKTMCSGSHRPSASAAGLTFESTRTGRMVHSRNPPQSRRPPQTDTDNRQPTTAHLRQQLLRCSSWLVSLLIGFSYFFFFSFFSFFFLFFSSNHIPFRFSCRPREASRPKPTRPRPQPMRLRPRPGFSARGLAPS